MGRGVGSSRLLTRSLHSSYVMWEGRDRARVAKAMNDPSHPASMSVTRLVTSLVTLVVSRLVPTGRR